ncbi:MAG: mannose-6-phosphate isomerase, class I [Candidatus Cloacimonetes bacterium]|jgi:mannose-6-phosphate isomerase|nr:mannose-6-phosphate isomerase, class I [Candidatus Cloacimonadota bacterium]MCB5287470.1 mannose-6-phosphate isomerase, class I [Candidatus Cloacimonadota bacterium]MCK9185244.1 mannose-6-phosphate isomerase, class I [Candidatus Cloacimonadota bacterium]MCK9583701.1 mannose-6-phosphate isomerase, class I [Candidatus Cloacimonadota bacterium]MDY0229791.1 mannose-6-phosphate isomerase, class I [Candidatus Cloacimonadaceae bacterium]
MKYLKAALQPYLWGSHSFIQSFLHLAESGPLAEAWYGAHPKAPSLIEGRRLNEIISAEPAYWLGAQQHELPYLMKILAADQALSIQVHPSKSQAEIGFARENEQGLPLSDPIRNYRDDNHKPELIMALTDFHALCGFRSYAQIIEAFQDCGISGLFQSFPRFAKELNSASFTLLYKEIITRPPLTKLNAILLQLPTEGKWAQEIIWMQELSKLYPNDNSVISPLLMNLILLKPYQAISLQAGIVHAYLRGAGIEIMACSDNVLRAGLTPKHIDTRELLKVMSMEPYLPQIIAPQLIINQLTEYHTPVPDFALYRIKLQGQMQLPCIPGPKILLGLQGRAKLKSGMQSLMLNKADSIIIPHEEQNITLSGEAELVMAGLPGNGKTSKR